MLIEHKQECLKWRPPSTSPVCLYFLWEWPSIYGQLENTNNPPPPVKNRPLLSQSFLRCLCVCLRGLLIACLLLQRLYSSQQGSSQPPSAPHLKHEIEINWKCCQDFFKPPSPSGLWHHCVFSPWNALPPRFKMLQSLHVLAARCSAPGRCTSLAPSITTSWPWRRTKTLQAFFYGPFKLKCVICQPKHHAATLACNLNKHPFNTFQTAE